MISLRDSFLTSRQSPGVSRFIECRVARRNVRVASRILRVASKKLRDGESENVGHESDVVSDGEYESAGCMIK